MKIINLDNIDKKSISNIVFDWGGVITNLNIMETVKAFSNLGLASFESVNLMDHQDDFFGKLEKGLIDPEEFYNEFRKYFETSISNTVIHDAWCKMLLDTPVYRIELLKKLAQKFTIYLLSNTNKIHADYYNKYLHQKYHVNYEALFHKVYYSHELGMRKPERELFEFLISDNALDPHKTLFIDDTEINVDMASSCGIIALYLTNDNTIEKIFKKWAD
jgi:glucose-1-phosphatase